MIAPMVYEVGELVRIVNDLPDGELNGRLAVVCERAGNWFGVITSQVRTIEELPDPHLYRVRLVLPSGEVVGAPSQQFMTSELEPPDGLQTMIKLVPDE